MRAQHRYQIMLAMASSHRKPLHEAVTEPGDYDEPSRPTSADAAGEEEPSQADWDVGSIECSAGDCDDLPEIDERELCALEPSEAELCFSFAPVEILLDGVAI